MSTPGDTSDLRATPAQPVTSSTFRGTTVVLEPRSQPTAEGPVSEAHLAGPFTIEIREGGRLSLRPTLNASWWPGRHDPSVKRRSHPCDAQHSGARVGGSINWTSAGGSISTRRRGRRLIEAPLGETHAERN